MNHSTPSRRPFFENRPSRLQTPVLGEPDRRSVENPYVRTMRSWRCLPGYCGRFSAVAGGGSPVQSLVPPQPHTAHRGSGFCLGGLAVGSLTQWLEEKNEPTTHGNAHKSLNERMEQFTITTHTHSQTHTQYHCDGEEANTEASSLNDPPGRACLLARAAGKRFIRKGKVPPGGVLCFRSATGAKVEAL